MNTFRLVSACLCLALIAGCTEQASVATPDAAPQPPVVEKVAPPPPTVEQKAAAKNWDRLKFMTPEERATEWLVAMDKNKDGLLSKEEYVGLVTANEENGQLVTQAESHFGRMDVDKDGKVTTTELTLRLTSPTR